MSSSQNQFLLLRECGGSRSNKLYYQVLFKNKEYCGEWQNLTCENNIYGYNLAISVLTQLSKMLVE